jgi:protein tyrosine/serine phosphatase
MAWINLDGAVNVRDLGGLPLGDGGTTAAGQLLRADNLQELSPADVKRLVADVGVTTVVDLRSSHELTAEGPAPLDAVPEVRHAHHPVLPELGSATDVVADAILARRERDMTRYPDNPLTGHYLGYLEDRPDEVVDAVRSIASSGGAAIVHCAAGKDRTGVVVALALGAVGVLPDAIVADYVATGDRVHAIVGRLRRRPIYADDIDSKPPAEHLPQADTMRAFLTELDARYGGAAGWLTANGIGDDLPRLRAKLAP